MDLQDSFIHFERSFWHLSRKMENVWKEVYANTFPGSQSRIMYLLKQDGPQKMSELATALHITAGAVTTASDILIQNGYLTRIRDQQDRRVVRLALTEKGEVTLIALQNEGHNMMKTVFKDLSNEDLQRLCMIFEKASLNIDHLAQQGGILEDESK